MHGLIVLNSNSNHRSRVVWISRRKPNSYNSSYYFFPKALSHLHSWAILISLLLTPLAYSALISSLSAQTNLVSGYPRMFLHATEVGSLPLPL